MRHVVSAGTVLVGLAVVLGVGASGWADDCCDESSTECRASMTHVGDKGTCTVAGEVCVQIADHCPAKKKHPGRLCQCGTASSNLGVSKQSVEFDSTHRRDSFMLTNGGNVPVDVTIMPSGDTDAFAISKPKKCKGDSAPGDPTATSVTLHAQGCANLKAKFKSHKVGIYSEQFDFSSNALTTPTQSTTLFGTLSGH